MDCGSYILGAFSSMTFPLFGPLPASAFTDWIKVVVVAEALATHHRSVSYMVYSQPYGDFWLYHSATEFL